MSKIIRSPEALIPGKRKDSTYVFLAGPIQGVHDWQTEDIPDLGEGITLINPRRAEHPDPTFDWNEQVSWETAALRVSDYVLFWVPKEEEHIEGRDYAQTTKIELMENLARGKNIVFGIDPEVHTRRYLVHKFEAYTNRKAHDNLEDCIKELKEMISERENGDRTFFTSDTHFGSVRTLQLSKRPFLDDLEMDWTMIERWNKVVSPSARVIHLGDFGDYEAAKYLNGNITLMYGNYERKDHEGLEKKPIDWLKEHNIKVVDPTVSAMQVKGFEEDPELKLVLGHEPLNVKKFLDTRDADQGSWCLFGHIHARQRVKKFGVDVGVDGNNFTPMSLKDVKFYLEAIDKHYDEEVWS
jgi:calcineurin-like phosphoesterase family protein